MHTVTFWFDVVCPYSYLEGVVIEALEDSGELTVEWCPFELRPPPAPLLDPRGDHLRTDWTANVYRLAQGAGIEIHLPRFQPRSTGVLAACLWATDQGALRPFRRALCEAFFCEGEDIATEPQLARAATKAGLDRAGAVAASFDPDLLRRLRELRAVAVSQDVRGAPTLVTADGHTHWGMGGAARLLGGEPLVPRPSRPH